ncbi:hypothetical protein [Bacillus sp. V3B]|nr:hypothetical protein [Bacillus sp. V3B]
MDEKEINIPNVNLKGKLNKQKGEQDAGQLRYGQKNQTEGRNRK